MEISETFDMSENQEYSGDGNASADDDEDDGKERWKMIICVREDLRLSSGKMAAQVGHAVHWCVRNSKEKDLKCWEKIGCMKVVLGVRDSETLKDLQRKATAKGLVNKRIKDAGRTEIPRGTETVLGIGPARVKDVNAVTGHLRPLNDALKSLRTENEKFHKRVDQLEEDLSISKQKLKKVLANQHIIRKNL